MQTPTWRSQRAAYIAYVGSIGIVYSLVNTAVRGPYMDEIFHIGQAQRYTRTWAEYDPKLTTPPGLYIPSALLGRYISKFAVTVPALRLVNAALLIYLPHLFSDLLYQLRGKNASSRRDTKPYLEEAICISTFPLVYFFGFLYYTDVASLTSVLLAYRQALRQSYLTSALVGFASLTFRQTNILWIAYIAFEAVTLELDKVKTRAESPLHATNDLSQISLVNVCLAVRNLILAAIRNPKKTVSTLLPYIPVALAFGAFLLWNGSIVLGDRTMHVAVLHVPQIYYFASFTVAMLVPHLLDTTISRSTFSTLASNLRRVAASVVITGCIVYTIRKFTVVHPFLLADNRHYPFYIWRRIVDVHPYSRYLLAPVYLASIVAIWKLLGSGRIWGTLPFLSYAAVTCLTLIPSPLLEFRYFIVPYTLLRLHVKPSSKQRLRLESLVHACINLVTIAVFLYRPFTWPSEPGWQRFMW